MTEHFQRIFATDPKLLGIYIVVYFLWGVLMHNFGIYTRIARFKYWWQIITCYILYMIPISLLLLPFAWWQQYAYGLFFMGILEFGGYAIGSSHAYDNNLLDRFFGPRNFSLAMTLFFAAYFPIGNAAVGAIYGAIWG
jgi:hypothetical protein